MMIRPMIPTQTASIPDTTDLVDLIKAPLRHFQTPTHIRTPPKIETQATDDSELFTQAVTLNPNIREALISEGQR